MKKLLLIAAASTALLSSAVTLADENQFYVGANVGASKLNKAKDKDTGFKMKSKANFIGEIVAGYYVMDNVRADLALGFLANAEMKKTVQGITAKHKPQIMSLLLSGYVDLFDVSIVKVFAGAGVGLAQVKEKISWSNPVSSDSTSTKKANNFAYKLTVGATAELAPGVKGDLAYSWRDYAKTKDPKAQAYKGTGKTAYRGHNVTVGVRFDI